MSSDNPSGADNQQERLGSPDWLNAVPLDLGHYVAGFVDGEGSFNVPIPSRIMDPFSQAPAFVGSLVNRESSEAIRGAPSLKRRDEDMVHAL